MALAINPIKQTNAPGAFGLEWDGFIAGMAQDDPALRFHLRSGILDAAETLPMFGGIAIAEYIPGVSGNPRPELGPTIKRATQFAGATPSNGDVSGFCVFDQNHSAIMSAESAVPQIASGMTLHFYELGSKARLALPIAPAFAGILAGKTWDYQFAWDFAYQWLVPLESGTGTGTISAATWASGQATFTVGTDLTSQLSAGDPVLVSGVTPSGYNGTWTIVSITATTIVVTMPSNPGAYSSGGTAANVTTAKTAFPGKVLGVNVGNSMVPVYDAATGFVNWSRTGAVALVQI